MPGQKRKTGGSDGYFARVYAVVARIPRGKVMTYGQIALALGGGRSARVVGFAMRAAPETLRLPCHRVVNRNGEMAPGWCFGGADRQRRLLRREGVAFGADGRIDLARSRWVCDGEPTSAAGRRTPAGAVQENRSQRLSVRRAVPR